MWTVLGGCCATRILALTDFVIVWSVAALICIKNLNFSRFLLHSGCNTSARRSRFKHCDHLGNCQLITNLAWTQNVCFWASSQLSYLLVSAYTLASLWIANCSHVSSNI